MKNPHILMFSLFLVLIFAYPGQAQTRENTPVLLENSKTVNKKEMADKVKDEFLHAWNGYKKYAWGYDALQPLTKKPHNWYKKSLLMTPVDAFDTMILMGLTEEAAEAKELIFKDLDFDVDMEAQNFEVSIRILGGLLSAYELDGDPRFLKLAEDLGKRLMKAFNSPTGMPYRYVNLKTGATSGPVSNPAEIGTYLVEYGTLSKHTGNPVYYQTALKAMTALYALRSPLNLTAEGINIETGKVTNPISHISGCIDSYLEYMLKGSILFNDKQLSDMWIPTIEAVNKYLADQTPDGLWYGHADMYTGKITETSYGALDAFFSGTLAMNKDLKRAAALQNSNYSMWMQNGVEPESMNYITKEVENGSYILRPENIEGAYCLYQYTHDDRYLEMGANMFNNLVKYCRTDDAYAALKDVRTKEKKDYMESFFFAETLKYAFLLFDDSGKLDFNKVIFNTEAHPYKRD
ncbi:MAG: glycoside hydrolase family 47 protein [Bacteroidales bacterium]|nr:glycoside hydrolase family 47 protein [Bacteroidales bacterium]